MFRTTRLSCEIMKVDREDDYLNGYSYHPTWEAARQAVVRELEDRLEQAKAAQERLVREIDRVKGLPNPELVVRNGWILHPRNSAQRPTCAPRRIKPTFTYKEATHAP